MPVSFDQPWLLLALLSLPLFWWVARHSLADLAPLRRNIALGLRCVIVLAVVLALAGMNWVKRNSATCTLFVVDASYSLPRAKREQALAFVRHSMKNMRDSDRVGVIAFGSDARLAVPPMERGQMVAEMTVPDGSQTNIARAVTFALSAFPPNMAKRIVLVSDGNENAGDARQAAQSAAVEDVPVDVITLSNDLQEEATLDRMLTPPDAKRGEPFPVKVVATSLKGGQGTLRLFRNGKYVGEQKVNLKPGKNVITLPQKAETPGFYTYEAILTTGVGQDTLSENNRAMSFVKVQGKPRILAVEGVPGQEKYLTRALQAQKVDVDVRPPAQIPTQMAQLLSYDAVVLSDVPASALTQTQMKVLQAGVRDMGMGLAMVGGEQAFGAGGYFKTPIEEALPVEMDVRKMRRYPGVALALAIDRSGSMGACHCGGTGERVNGGINKTDVSREAANRAVEALNPADQVGVIAVDNIATTVVPMQYATDKDKIRSGIGTIEAGGNTNLAGGVRAAYEMLLAADAKLKHAILVTDGWSNKYDYTELIAKMRRAKITLTVVAVDEGENLSFLRALEKVAKETGGRYYLVQDVRQIPKIYTREVQTVSKPPIIEEPFAARVAAPDSPIISGISWEAAPPLLGYDVVNPKPTAEVSLVSHRGDTVLATWQYGLGKSLAFTSDAKARWGAQWVGWQGFGPFWAQALRWTLKRSDNGSYQTGIELDGGRGRVTVDAVDKEGAFVNFLDARARVVGPDGTMQTVRLTQTGSGRYEGVFDATRTGSYVATVTQKGADNKTRITNAGLAVPYSPEFRDWRPNESLLTRVADLTGGKMLPSGETVFQERRIARTPVSLALPLLLFALLLFPLDVATRRLMLSGGQAREMWDETREKAGQRVAARKQRARNVQAATASMNRLLERKARLQAEEEGYDAPQSARDQEASAPPPSQSSSVTWGVPPPATAAPPPQQQQRPAEPPASSRPPTNPPAGEEPPAAGGYRSRLLDAKRRAARSEEEDG